MPGSSASTRRHAPLHIWTLETTWRDITIMSVLQLQDYRGLTLRTLTARASRVNNRRQPSQIVREHNHMASRYKLMPVV